MTGTTSKPIPAPGGSHPRLSRWANHRMGLVGGIITLALLLRLALLLGVSWRNSSDLDNYFWAGATASVGENPYQLWRDDPAGPRSDLLPLELLLFAALTRIYRSPLTLQLFFLLADALVLLLLARRYRASPRQQWQWLLFYGFGPGPLLAFTLTPSDKPFLLALFILLLAQAASARRRWRWPVSITVGLMAALKWLGLVIALPVLHRAARGRLRHWLLLLLVSTALFAASHLPWLPDWAFVYAFRAHRLAGPPFHAGIAVVLQALGLPMPMLYFALFLLCWIVVNGAWWLNRLSWDQAAALSFWAFVYWTPDSTPQMMLLTSLVLLLTVPWHSRGRSLAVWLSMLFVTGVFAASVYPILGGPVDLSWAVPLVGHYGSVRMAFLSQFLVWVCLLLLWQERLPGVVSQPTVPGQRLAGGDWHGGPGRNRYSTRRR